MDVIGKVMNEQELFIWPEGQESTHQAWTWALGEQVKPVLQHVLLMKHL